MLELIDHPLKPDAPIVAGRIHEIRLSRPPVNALNGSLLGSLIGALEGARDAAAIIVSGQPNVFSAGLDVPGMLALDRSELTQVFEILWRAQQAIALSPVPVIFGITGHCPAGGTVLAIHADYRVMAQGDFKLGLNEVQVGLYPGPVIHGAFRRLTGGHAAQLLTRGALIDPATAFRTGLVDELCEPAQCLPRALELAREFASLPRDQMLRTRELARQDLHELFGSPGEAPELARQFAEIGAQTWFSPATQERLRFIFARKR
jgi:Delta3-Delta2-enoyl-CoA isomerase